MAGELVEEIGKGSKFILLSYRVKVGFYYNRSRYFN